MKKSILCALALSSLFAVSSAQAYSVGYQYKQVCTREWDKQCSFDSIYVVDHFGVSNAVNDIDRRLRTLEAKVPAPTLVEESLAQKLIERINQLEARVQELESR